MTPLHVAAKKGESLEIVKYLICKGADINIQNNNKVKKDYTIDSTEGTVFNVIFFAV